MATGKQFHFLVRLWASYRFFLLLIFRATVLVFICMYGTEKPYLRIRDPGWVKIRIRIRDEHPDPGAYLRFCQEGCTFLADLTTLLSDPDPQSYPEPNMNQHSGWSGSQHWRLWLLAVSVFSWDFLFTEWISRRSRKCLAAFWHLRTWWLMVCDINSVMN